MGKHILFFHLLSLSLLLAAAGTKVVDSTSHHHHHHHHHHHLHTQNQIHGFSKLFVFGDSYADTGNNAKTFASWHEPYGITFPGKPSGRWSDGRVLTDYVASFLGIKSPVPYRWMKYGPKLVPFGINFAYGGSGVSQTLFPVPNMTVQINSFQQLIQKGLYTKKDLYSSVALVSLVGNDYAAYLTRNGTAEGLPAFIATVVNQLALNLKRINVMGVKTIVVTGLQPLGCLPQRTVFTSFQQCNETDNAGVIFHNQLLQQVVDKFNNESKDSSFLILDLYRSFKTILNQTALPGNMKFDDLLKPCCMGVNSSFSCGSKDENGVKMYTVCKNPKTAFFWDMFHPTQEGWKAVRLLLESYLFPPKS
ncbi:PREDICTED: GDSL esterase/lipase At5g03610-like [Nelumbo nucifera]|uniref:GDSL esterase/lipase At5g03610-like n=2 Tax=Nelumbo nucifera TaxID=4432 RepID=A0A1U7ZAX0_NELNU|nr:PREDICTED: GDSL esterase/lipase At5g03610-like [Nelumbo nucifera]DAD48600.1 TPA_asm: hypothetical protein HUJ06_018537 [Nelumbo nucifera]